MLSGENGDGAEFPYCLKQTKGMIEVDTIIGDAAHSGK
jgi:hypothetical protein